jgi:hypothetical protein
MAQFQSWGDAGGNGLSPGGFEFGVTGWRWPYPVPSSVTFYLDNTASVFDQFGRPIKGVVLPDGKAIRFATTPPKADGCDSNLRKIFASHKDVVSVLMGEHIDLIQEMNEVGSPCPSCKGTGNHSNVHCQQCHGTGRRTTVVCSGWPQLPYDQLKQLNKMEWPFDKEHKVGNQRCGCVSCNIQDPALRKDALKMRREIEEKYAKEMAAASEE